jgi:hypothetical protein
MSNDKPRPLSAPNAMSGAPDQEATNAQNLAILQIFAAAAAQQPDDRGPGLHASEVIARGIPGLSSFNPADREKARVFMERLEQRGLLKPAPGGIGRSKSVAHGLRINAAKGGPEIERLKAIESGKR